MPTSGTQIYRAKPGCSHCSSQCIEAVVNQWQRVAILVRNGIQSSVVNAETQTSVFLADEDDVRHPETGSRLNNAVAFHLVYFSVNDFKVLEFRRNGRCGPVSIWYSTNSVRSISYSDFQKKAYFYHLVDGPADADCWSIPLVDSS